MGKPFELDTVAAMAARAAAPAATGRKPLPSEGSSVLSERFAVINGGREIVGNVTYATRGEAEAIRAGLRRELPSAGPLGLAVVRERLVRDVAPIGLIN